ncbi:Nuclear transport factor 2, partial [Globisporangium splendens]
MSAEQVATAFVQHYYTTFDQNRAGLANLYQDVSTMSWEGTMLTGQQAIVQKLSQLPQVLHEYPTVDVQPSTSPNAILIFVQGKLKIEDNNPIQFTQVFQLVAHQQGAYYIHNDVFRLHLQSVPSQGERRRSSLVNLVLKTIFDRERVTHGTMLMGFGSDKHKRKSSLYEWFWTEIDTKEWREHHRTSVAALPALCEILTKENVVHFLNASAESDCAYGAASPRERIRQIEMMDLRFALCFVINLQIGELDKLVAKMKQQQATCLAAVAHYESEMGNIDKEVKNIIERYTPMCKRLEQRRDERAQLQRQVQDVAKQSGAILSITKKQLCTATHDHVQHIRHEASSELAGARGYSLGKESTVYQKTTALSPTRK